MRVFVSSYGCSTNLADGQALSGCLISAGYTLADSIACADVVVCNTCAVKGPTENRMISILKKVPSNKKLVVAGCLPMINMERLDREVRFDGAVGPAAGESIVDVVRRISNGERIVTLKDASENMPKLGLPRVGRDSVISIIPISYGCLGSCAYCCVTFARGRLRSYAVEEIIEKARADIQKGASELWLSSQDTACYGKDRNTNLADLLRQLCKVEGDFRIRVGMMTPNNALNILDELLKAFYDEHVFKFIHLPVQSGDDQILKDMCRFHSAEDFSAVAAAFRGKHPELTLATDVICGFPGETDEAFSNTLRLIRDVKPEIVNVSKFAARPRTAAARMQEKFVSSGEIRRRSTIVSRLAKKIALERNKLWVGWTGDTLIDEVGKIRDSWIGRNSAYRPIVVKSTRRLFGKTVKAEVTKAFISYLQGEIVE